jgi:hypothetical protein
MIMQKRGTGYTTVSSNYWWDEADQSISIPWPKDTKKDGQTKLLRAVVTIYAITF